MRATTRFPRIQPRRARPDVAAGELLVEPLLREQERQTGKRVDVRDWKHRVGCDEQNIAIS